jgi:ATP-dependent DNA helicase RecQ
MIKYSQARECRRAVILGYFGDTAAAEVHCGHCDNCGPGAGEETPRASHPIDTPAGQEVLLKVLSGVARAKGRFGKNTVAQMLAGSASEKMDRWGLKRLSTYGLLNAFRQPELVQILDALESAGQLESTEVDRFRQIVNLTTEGWERLRSKGPLDFPLTLPDDLRKKVQNGGLERIASRLTTGAPLPAADVDPNAGAGAGAEAGAGADGSPGGSPLHDDPLWQQLKTLRQEWAGEAQMPAYIVFPNQVLDELVRTRPRTPQALATIKGFGPARLERYGAALLAAIAGSSHQGVASAGKEPLPLPLPLRPVAASAPITAPSPARPRSTTEAFVPTEEWTWRLLDRGFTLEEAAAIRGLLLPDIVRHAVLSVRQGKPLDPALLLAPEIFREWDAWLAGHGDAAPPPGDRGPAGLWPLFVACRTRQ